MKSNSSNVNLLWTGGSDSTFQLLQLLIIYKQPVIPYYIIDEERPSTGIEILTRKRIKDRLLREYPHTLELLKPTRFYSKNDILPNPKVTGAYHSILKKKHIGSQYDWLARFCEEKGITNMQLSIERPKAIENNYWGTLLYPGLIESTFNSQKVFTVDTNYKKKEIIQLFKYFQFPIIKTTKAQMFEITKKQGLRHIMEMTWFCMSPTSKKKPCGKCTPCLQAIKHGVGWRLSLKSRIISFFYKIFILPIKMQLKYILIKLKLFKKVKKYIKK